MGTKKINRIMVPEFTQAVKCIEEGEYDEALKLLDIFEKKAEVQNYDKLHSYHLKGQLLIWQSRFEEAIKICEKFYKFSQLYDYKDQSINALILLSYIYTYQFKHDRAFKMISDTEKILNIIPQKSPKFLSEKKAHLYYCQGIIFFHEGNLNKTFKYLEKSIALREEIDNKQDLAASLYFTGRCFAYNGKFDQALEFVKRGLTFAIESKSMFYVGISYNTLGTISLYKGKVNQALAYFEKCIAIFKKIRNMYVIGGLYNNISNAYYLKGELTQALDYLEKCLEIDKTYVNIEDLKVNTLDTAIQIALEINNKNRAHIYFQDLKNINDQTDNENIKLTYLYNKALLLKSSSLRSDQISACEILKEIVGKKFSFNFEISFKALLNLSELLLTELDNTNNLKLLDQLRFYINQIIDLARNQKLHLLLVESYLLEIKLNLITLNLNKAQKILIKAQKVAEKYDIKQLIERLYREQKKILEQKNKWLNLKNSDQRIIEFANLAPMKDQITYMLKKREIFRNLI